MWCLWRWLWRWYAYKDDGDDNDDDNGYDDNKCEKYGDEVCVVSMGHGTNARYLDYYVVVNEGEHFLIHSFSNYLCYKL